MQPPYKVERADVVIIICRCRGCGRRWTRSLNSSNYIYNLHCSKCGSHSVGIKSPRLDEQFRVAP